MTFGTEHEAKEGQDVAREEIVSGKRMATGDEDGGGRKFSGWR